MLKCVTLQYSVSIWTVKEQHLLKPEACFKGVMEEVVTASLQLILGGEEEEEDDRWVNFIFDPKENSVNNVNSVQAGRPGIHKKIKVDLSPQRFRCAFGVYFHLMLWSILDAD